MMHSTRMGQPQSVILYCDDDSDECLLRKVKDYIWGCLNTADNVILIHDSSVDLDYFGLYYEI